MEPFRRHVFVCTQAKPEGVTSCPANGSFGLLQALDREILAHQLDDEVQVTTCGCLGLCDDGPIMIVYPEGTWYRRVRVADVPEIVQSHLRDGNPLARLAWTEAAAMKKLSGEHRDRFRAMVKAKDQAGILPDDLNETIRGFMRSRVVLTALELDVFTAVAKNGSFQELARKIGADPRATEMLLNALVSLKLLEKKDGLFFNTPASARFLAEGSPDNARPGLLHTAHLWHRWSMLTDSVRAGTAVSSHAPEEDWTTSFIAAMDRNAKERAGALTQAIEGNGIKRMLDLGGGSGAYSIALARKFPHLKAEILDLPGVVPLAQQYIQKAGLAGRITARTGDMLRDPLVSCPSDSCRKS
jgi:(2Fe-2S) ferredoxin